MGVDRSLKADSRPVKAPESEDEGIRRGRVFPPEMQAISKSIAQLSVCDSLAEARGCQVNVIGSRMWMSDRRPVVRLQTMTGEAKPFCFCKARDVHKERR